MIFTLSIALSSLMIYSIYKFYEIKNLKDDVKYYKEINKIDEKINDNNVKLISSYEEKEILHNKIHDINKNIIQKLKDYIETTDILHNKIHDE